MGKKKSCAGFWRQIVQGKNMNCAGILGDGGRKATFLLFLLLSSRVWVFQLCSSLIGELVLLVGV